MRCRQVLVRGIEAARHPTNGQSRLARVVHRLGRAVCLAFAGWVLFELGRIAVRAVVDAGLGESVLWFKAFEGVVVLIAFVGQSRTRHAGRTLWAMSLGCGVAGALLYFDLRSRAPWAPFAFAPLLLALSLPLAGRSAMIRTATRGLYMLGFVIAAGVGWALGSGYCWFPIPGRAPTAAATRDARWKQDLDYLARELPRLHGNAFHTTTAARFAARRLAVEAGIPTRNDTELAVDMAALVATIGDAHTLLAAGAQGHHRVLPLRLGWFRDGLFVVAVEQDRAELCGRRLTRVGAWPIEKVCGRLRAIVSHENDSWFAHSCLRLLENASVLQALGLLHEDDAVPLELVDDRGERRTITLHTKRAADGLALTRYLRGRPRIAPQPGDFWFTRVTGEDAIYFRYSRCRWSFALRAVAKRLFAELDACPTTRLVIDLRGNSGGTSMPFHWFVIPGIRARPALDRAKRLFVLIDRGTFSSGCGIASTLRTSTHATLVGEPTGGKPNSWGEVRWFALPNSGLRVLYSTVWHERIPGTGAASLAPDHRVLPTHADWQEQLDPVLERALGR